MNFIIDSLKKYNPLYNLSGSKKLGFGADLSLNLFGTEDLPRNVTAQQQEEQRVQAKEIDTQTEPIATRPVFRFQDQNDRALAARFNQSKNRGGGGGGGGVGESLESRLQIQRDRALAARINQPKPITPVPAAEIGQVTTKIENLRKPTVAEFLQTNEPTSTPEERMPKTTIRATEPLLEEKNPKKTKTSTDDTIERRLAALRETPKALPKPPLKSNPNPNIVKTPSGAIALGPQEIKQETGFPFAAPASVQPVVQQPVVQQPAPVVQQPAPVVQQPEPVVQQPVVQQPAPVVQQPAPVVQQPEPVFVFGSSAVEQTKPSLSMEQVKQYVDEQIRSNQPPPLEEEMKEKETRENPFLENPQKQKRKKATVEQQIISLNPREVEFISEKETKQPQFNIDEPKKIASIKSSAPLLPNAPKTLPKVFLESEKPRFVDQLLSKFKNPENARNIQLASEITKNFEQKDIEETINETGQPTTQKELDKLKNILGKRKKRASNVVTTSISKPKGTTRVYPKRKKQPAPIETPQEKVDS